MAEGLLGPVSRQGAKLIMEEKTGIVRLTFRLQPPGL